MKKNILKTKSLVLTCTLLLSLALTGCGNSDSKQETDNHSSISGNQNSNDKNSADNSVKNSDTDNHAASANQTAPAVSSLEVCFGDNGSPFILHLYDNETAAAIARHVGTADWRLPIYHYDDYDNWEVMQYYDIPSRYDIPSNPETITSEKAGEVYYSAPNRIVLYYGDAEVTGEYTKVGYFDFTEEFQNAVKNNPVLTGWGNKIVLINSAD